MEAKNNNQQAIGLQTFLNENIGAEIRTITVDEELFFVGRDIALSLGYANPVSAISQHVDNEDSVKYAIPDNQGFNQITTLVNESGMYALILAPNYQPPKPSRGGSPVKSSLLSAAPVVILSNHPSASYYPLPNSVRNLLNGKKRFVTG